MRRRIAFALTRLRVWFLPQRTAEIGSALNGYYRRIP